MSRGLLDKSQKEIHNFESIGFAKSSPVLLRYMRNKNGQDIRIFRPCIGSSGTKGSIRYGCSDIFGHRFFIYIYDIRFRKKFVDYLVNAFLAINPDPDISIRKAFTHMLHNNGLHWEQCSCINKIEEGEKDIDKKEVFVWKKDGKENMTKQ